MVTPTARPRSTRAHTPISWLCEAESLRARETGVVHCPAGRDRAADTCGSLGRPGSWARRRSTTPAIGSGFGPGKGFGMPLHSLRGGTARHSTRPGICRTRARPGLSGWTAVGVRPTAARDPPEALKYARGRPEIDTRNAPGKSRGVSKAIRSFAFGSEPALSETKGYKIGIKLRAGNRSALSLPI